MSDITKHNENQRVETLLSKLTLEEKVSLCHANSKFTVAGVKRLGIPELVLSDGPHGVREELDRHGWGPAGRDDDYGTYLPTGTALAATWNPELAKAFGEVLGAEARHRAKDIILGPGINIIRTPLCGRNFEYFSEDPYFIRKMAVPVICGIQAQGVAACIKHYALNNQELDRGYVDVQVDERTLREIYLPGFEAAVREGEVWSAMGAYNRFRGQHCCHHDYLVNGILKNEWGFDGVFMSDWNGTHDSGEGIHCGLDLEMGTNLPYEEYYLAAPFLEGLKNGAVDPAILDDKVRRILRLMIRIGALEEKRPKGARNTKKHQETAYRIAAEAMVLLKNEGGILPLNRTEIRSIAVIGSNAVTRHARGGGSSGVKALYEVSPLEGIKRQAGEKTEVRYVKGYPEEVDAIPTHFLGVADEGSGTHGWRLELYEEPWSKKQPYQVIPTDMAIIDWSADREFYGRTTSQIGARFTSILTIPETGRYAFVIHGTHGTQFLSTIKKRPISGGIRTRL